jgi:hypothetical protein
MSTLTNHRTLQEIGLDLSHTIQNKTAGMLRTGQLLNEARESAEHTEWLPFLKLHRIEARSAQNYMKAAAWADTKCETVSYFELSKIAPKAIYELARGKYTDDVVKLVLWAAEHRHIGLKDLQSIAKTGEKAAILREIRRELKLEAEAKRLAEAKEAGFDTVEEYEADIAAKKKEAQEKRKQERAEKKSAKQEDDTEDGDDGSDGDDEKDAEEKDDDSEDDDDTEETNEPSQAQLKAISKFDAAVEELRKLWSQSLKLFDDVKTPTDVIDEASRFLEEVSQRRKLKSHTTDAHIDASKLN